MEPWQYIALLGAVIAVAALLLPRGKTENHTQDRRNFEGMELAFEQFMESMEQQHKDLVSIVTESQQKVRDEIREKNLTIQMLEKKVSELEEGHSSLSHALVAVSTKLNMLQSPVSNANVESLNQTKESVQEEKVVEHQSSIPTIEMRFPELFEMYNNGKSIESIAKKIGKNKGEVQLIIQLAKQEGAVRNA